MAIAALLHPLETRQKHLAQEIQSTLLTAPGLPALFVEERLRGQDFCLCALLVQLAGEAAAERLGALAQEEMLSVAACAMELWHLGVLAHEEVLDGTAIPGRLSARSLPLGPLDQVLVGDYLHAKATAMLGTLGAAPDVWQVFGDLTAHWAAEKLRKREQPMRDEWTERAYLEDVYAKSAVLLASCCKLGALLTAGRTEAVEAVTSYGYALGMAVQIQEDLQQQVQAALYPSVGLHPTSLQRLAHSYLQKAEASLSVLPANLPKYLLVRLPHWLLGGKKGSTVHSD